MASRKKKTKESDISIGLSLALLVIGFVIGVFISPRIADVITQFGIKRDKTISQVEPTPIKEKTGKEIADKEKTEEEKGKYTLQIAAFEDIESALGLADTLYTRGYSPYIQFSSNSDRALYQLRLGFWTSEQDADNFAKTFERQAEMKSRVVELK